MKLTMLGTGHAMVTQCYNTCFVISEGEKHFLVDGGGGNGLMQQLEKADIDFKNIRDIFVTHKHVDHVLGIVWMVRLICQSMNQGKYEGEARIYAHKELIEIIRTLAYTLLQEKQTKHIDKRLLLVPVEDGEERQIIGHTVKFFDIHSTKDKQFGFTMWLNADEKLTCCGDEPYNESEKAYVEGSKWLLHEAFCLYAEADTFKPYEKHHSTAKDACEIAEKLNVQNILLYHTEDKNISNRKVLYKEEGQNYFQGNIYVPDDLELIEL